MKRIFLAVLAATVSTSAFAARIPGKEGRLIGDGKTIPREYVRGKGPIQRRDEIANWMLDRGATQDRGCNTAEKYCVDMVTMPLIGGETLIISAYQEFGRGENYSTYCRVNAANDTSFCYGFETGAYFLNVKDTMTGKWEVVWDERTPPKQGQQTPKAATNEIEM